MKVQIHIGTTVHGGYDKVGNPIQHQVDVALDGKSRSGEPEEFAVMRMAHTAIGALAHVIGDLLQNQGDDIIEAALSAIGFTPDDLEDDDDDGGSGGGDDNNDMPPHPDQGDVNYGWNDGTPPDDPDEPGNAELRGVTLNPIFFDKPMPEPELPF